MKRVILLIAVVAIAFVCLSAGGFFAEDTHPSELVSTVTEKLSPALDKAKRLLSTLGDSEDQATDDDEGQAATSEEGSSWSLPSLGDIGFTPSVLSSTEDVVLVPTDDYAQGYVFEYDGEQFTAYFDTYSWRVYDSYKITNHDDIVIICQALINEHPVYGSDWESFRTADDMAYEWEQHNLVYRLLPEDSHWRDDAKDVDLDPYDQGKSFAEIYESRTGEKLSEKLGEKLDIKEYLRRE